MNLTYANLSRLQMVREFFLIVIKVIVEVDCGKYLPTSSKKIIQVRLVGVAFYEKPVRDKLNIVCHGHRSICGKLLSLIKTEWV